MAIRGSLSIVCLVFVGFLVADEQLPPPKEGKLLKEVWEAAFLEGSQAGYAHATFREMPMGEPPNILASSEMELNLVRFGQQLQLKFGMSDVENPTGKMLGFVADDEEAAVRVLGGLRRGGARFLVVDFAVNHRREAVLRVTPHVLPDVQDRAARRVDERAALPLELRQLADRDAERRQNHDVVRTERGTVFARVGKDVNPFFAEAVVDVRVVDDLAGQQHALRGEFLPSLVRVIDRAVHAVAEPEFLRQVERETSARLNEPGCLEVVDDAAVIGRCQVGRDRLFQVETLTEDDRGHPLRCCRTEPDPLSARSQ